MDTGETFKLWSEIISTWVSITQGCVTTIGVLVAGIWSYYVFVRGRNFDPNIKIEINQKSVIEIKGKKATIITAKVKNIGKTRVDKDSCVMKVMPLVTDKNGLFLFEEDTPRTQELNLLLNHSFLEPSEEIYEDILISLDKTPAIKLLIKFSGGFRNPLYPLFGNSEISSSVDSIITPDGHTTS